MSEEIEESYEITLEWLTGYIDGLSECKTVTKGQIDNLIGTLSSKLRIFPHIVPFTGEDID